MSKPTIDEQIARVKWLIDHLKNEDELVEVLASLEELKRIQSAEMPVEPMAFMWVESGKHADTQDGPGDYYEEVVLDTSPPVSGDYVKLYGPELMDYAQRKDAEAREQRERAERYKGIASAFQVDWNKEIDMREKAEKEKAALIAENEGLRKDGGLNMRDPEGQKYAGFPNDDALAAFKEQS